MEGTSSRDSLLVRVAQGDADAVRSCIDRFGPLVWSLTRRMFPTESAAEDCVQEIFIEIWRSAERYDPERGSEAAFIGTIARRRLIDLKRRLSRTGPSEPIESHELGDVDQGLDHIEICDEADLARKMLEKLEPQQKHVVELSVRDGLSHRQIAEHLSLPLGTVKSHVRRGLMRVSELLQSPRLASAEEVTS